MDGQDIIGHLMDVEREAAQLLSEAQAEADKRRSFANTQASSRFKDAYEKLVTELDAKLEAGKREVDARRASELASYQTRIESIQQDTAAFTAYLDSVFSGT